MPVAILIGATGLIGQHLPHTLLDEDAYTTLRFVGLRSVGITHPKL